MKCNKCEADGELLTVLGVCADAYRCEVRHNDLLCDRIAELESTIAAQAAVIEGVRETKDRLASGGVVHLAAELERALKAAPTCPGCKERDALQQFVDFWGEDAQIEKLHEEVGELKDALEGDGDIMEEAADVSIMIDQFLLMFGRERFDRIRAEKIERTKKRMQAQAPQNKEGGG
jgi:NTP pyrophosphatase (non-canonical NTP hydrolase)